MIAATKSEDPALLRVEGLVKTFGPVKALAGVDLTIRRGEIHALLGENGAGKSTAVKCITGVYHPDEGKISLEGKEVQPRSTRDAENMGISTVYQEVNLLPNLSVEENVTLGRQKTKFLGMIDKKSASERAARALEKLGVKIDLKRQLSELPVALQQMVALARALDIDSKILIVDEPTASLDENEVQQLFEVMNRLRDKGIAIVFITHFLDQVFQMSDRITVLRNGSFIAEHLTSELSKSALLSDMIGKSFEMIATEPKELPPLENGEVRATRLSVSNVERRGMIKNLNLEILEGEVVGLAGLLGSGRTECARLIFGVDKPERGSVYVSGKMVQSGSPSSALENGIMLASEDRKTEGIFPNLTVLENIVIALQARRGMLNRIGREEAESIARKYIDAFKIKTSGMQARVADLSGGNQQKALLARWLAADPKTLILDEPTRGIDVGARAEIEKLIEDLSAKGLSILMISSEMDEEVRCCHRVLVLRDREIIGELQGREISEPAIVSKIAAHRREGIA